MAEYIYTYTLKKICPVSPSEDDINITDIAHSLSMMCRANGHFKAFHSVAQHCIECSKEAQKRELGPKLSLACLLHDASEAYLADITTPLKNELPLYREYENKLMDIIYKKYVGNLSANDFNLIMQIDKDILYYEFYHFTGIEISKKPQILTNPSFDFVPFDKVRDEFLFLFNELSQKNK